MTVRKERSNWRDERISARHRTWGFDCPMVDIDFLAVEYDYSVPKAIIEYKHENAKIDFTKLTSLGAAPQSYKALASIANSCDIPFFVVRYSDDFSKWHISPQNSKANEVTVNKEFMTELEYVEFLYNIRGRSLPEEIKEKIEGIEVLGGDTNISIFAGDVHDNGPLNGSIRGPVQ